MPRKEDIRLDKHHTLVPLEHSKGFRILRTDAPWLLSQHLQRIFASEQEARETFYRPPLHLLVPKERFIEVLGRP